MNALVPLSETANARPISEAEWRAHYKAVRMRLNRSSPEIQAKDRAERIEAQRTREERFIAMFSSAAERHKPKVAVKQHISCRDVQRVIAKEWGLSIEELISAKRTATYVMARFEAMWIVKQMQPHTSFPQLGKWFGDRDHTTALHGIRKTQARVDSNSTYAERLAALRARIEAVRTESLDQNRKSGVDCADGGGERYSAQPAA